MATMCECYEVSGLSVSPYRDVGADEPPQAGQLFGEAAVTLAVPLILAALVTLALPIAGLAGQ